MKFFASVSVFIACLLLAQIRSLPAAMQTTLVSSLSVSEEYTDNVGLTEDDTESDWTTVISPRLALDVLGKTEGLNLSYSPGFTFYAENEENDTIRHSASLSAWKQLTKHLELNISSAFTRTEQPYDPATLALSTAEQELLGLQDFTLRREREPHSTLSGDVGLSYQFGKRDDLRLGYRYQRTLQEADDAEDSTRHSPSLTVNYWLTRHFGTVLNAEYTRGEFSGDTDSFDEWSGSIKFIRNITKFLDGFVQYEHTVMDRQGENEDYQVYDPSAGFSWQFSEDGRLSLDLGYFIQDNEDGDDDSGLVVSGDISKGFDLDRRTSFRISGGSGYEQTYFGAENLGFTVYYQGSARLNHGLTKRLSADLSLDFTRNDYREQDPERTDDIWTAQAGLNWVMLQWASLSLNHTYRTVDSNLADEDYDENRVVFSITLTPRPHRFK